MIPAEAAISRVRRDLTLSTVLKGLIIGIGIATFLMRGAMGWSHLLVLAMLGVAWIVLSYRSAMGSRLAVDSQSLIAAGRYEAAEEQIEQVLGTFSLFRTSKLIGIHQLAVLRHAQKRWGDAAVLCRALLGRRLGPVKGVSKQCRLMLADAMLELDDPRAAHEALNGLYQQRLTLAEAINLVAVQADFHARAENWAELAAGIETKVQLAELMPSQQSARTQALLALAAKKTGRHDWATWLTRRAELLADVQELSTRRPILWELWRVEPGASPPSTSSSAERRGDVSSENL
ncbi:MAG TPA: hypothetical protein VGR35_11870 [Tepidisphaeraceae bacterium]|nr:hypothetical protein [Tepidisphaeraceae bacterium]